MERGFSSIEVLIALAIVTSGVAAAVLIILSGPAALTNARLERHAYGLADELLSAAWKRARIDFSALSAEAIERDEYLAHIAFTPVLSGFAARASSTVRWKNVFGDEQERTLYSLLVNPYAAGELLCSPFPVRDWKALRPIGTHLLSGGELLPLQMKSGYPISAIAVFGQMLAIGTASAASAEDATLFFFRLGNPNTPPAFQVAVDNAPNSARGISALVAGHGHLYAGNGFGSSQPSCDDSHSCAQLHIFNVQEPNAPEMVSALELATSTGPRAITTSGSRAAATSIAYRNGFVYLGLEKTFAGTEFNVIDVRNPEHPVWRSGVTLGRGVRSISVDGSYAYIGTSDSSRELIIVELDDPAHPKVAGSWNAPGATNFGLGSAIGIRNKTLFFGRTYVGNASEFFVLDADDPTHTEPIYEEDMGTTNQPESIVGIIQRDYLTYVLSGRYLRILNISNSYVPFLQAPKYTLSGTGSALACKGNTLYIGTNEHGASALEILTSF